MAHRRCTWVNRIARRSPHPSSRTRLLRALVACCRPACDRRWLVRCSTTPCSPRTTRWCSRRWRWRAGASRGCRAAWWRPSWRVVNWWRQGRRMGAGDADPPVPPTDGNDRVGRSAVVAGERRSCRLVRQLVLRAVFTGSTSGAASSGRSRSPIQRCMSIHIWRISASSGVRSALGNSTVTTGMPCCTPP